MATHSSVLAWRMPGMGDPGGLRSLGLHRVGHDWSDLVVVERWYHRIYLQGNNGETDIEISLMDMRSGDERWDVWRGTWKLTFSSVQFSSVTQSRLTLRNPMNHSMPGLPVHHQLPEFTQTHVHWVSDAIQPSHPLSSPSPPAPNPSQHQSLFQWVNSLHEVAKVLEFQL